MDKFFKPAAIAMIGASANGLGNSVIKNLLKGFAGPIYPVNPNYTEIEGLPCHPSLEAIPLPVDLAIILVPARAIPDVLKACSRKGIRRVIIESAGFSEAGREGSDLQARCAAIAREAGIRIWGPNCMGLVDLHHRHFFTFMHARIHDEGLIPGRISLIVQSGMMSAIFLAEMARRGIGIAKVCSIGNKMDVDECDLLPYLLEDEHTDVVALYLESIPRGRRLAEIAVRSAKPIVLLQGGRSQSGARAALSHT
jgi:acetyltransferase